jgi:uncharacterized protein (TIGR02757 family)
VGELADSPAAVPRTAGLTPLDELYTRYNDPAWLDPDPLAVALRYERPADLELAGLAAAALALGNAGLIVRAATAALAPLGSEPAKALAELGFKAYAETLAGFKYRFFYGRQLASLLSGAAALRAGHGSLEAAFLGYDDPREPDYAAAASGLVRALRAASPEPWPSMLLPDPADGSAAKPTFLYLRWMVRRDRVDPGPWTRCDPARLVVPLDTHMAAACRRYGFLSRRSVDLKAAREASEALRRIRPNDPLRYDFCMTRPGIRPDLSPDECFGCA